MNRRANLENLRNSEFDILVIGAGASGAGVALDAALRGYKVALIDRNDFCSETSAKSTKLIHGGVRYLEEAFMNFDFGQLKQVKHGLAERHTVLRNAPHLAHPLALVTPVFGWMAGLYYSIGLTIYDWFAKGDTLPSSKWLKKKELKQRVPTLDYSRIHSGVMYYDGQLNDARYCLALVQAASEAGASVINYAELTSFESSDNRKLTAAWVSDRETGQRFEVRARYFINCTGPFSDSIRHLAEPGLTDRIRPSKGVHAVLPLELLGSTEALLIPKTSDGRVVFAIPFEGKLLVGTTDSDYPDLENEPVLISKELEFLLSTLKPYLAKQPAANQLKAGFGWVRPLLLANSGTSTKQLLRDHEVELQPVSGLISLLGGKWTTYRLMAKDTVDVVDGLEGQEKTCTTESHLLPGAIGYSADLWKSIMQETGLDEDVCEHLSANYGSRWKEVLELLHENESWRSRLHTEYPFLQVEVIYAARYEMARTLRDFLARRTRLELLDWKACLDAINIVGDLLQSELQWNAGQKAEAVNEYREKVSGFLRELE